MVRAIVIPADGEEPPREIETSDPAAIAKAVDGFMEAVDIYELGVTVYVNESGLLRRLPFNSRVSFLWRYHVPAVRQRAMLVGDAPDRYGVELQDGGDGTWRTDGLQYADYWEAIMWAMLLLKQVPEATDARVVPIKHHEGTPTAT